MKKEQNKLSQFSFMVQVIQEFSEPKVVGAVARKLNVHKRTMDRWVEALQSIGFEFEKTKLNGCDVTKYQIIGYPKPFTEMVLGLTSKIIESETNKLFKPINKQDK
jgi:hypothetical protein